MCYPYNEIIVRACQPPSQLSCFCWRFIVVGVILREDINWWHSRCHLFKNKRVKYLRAMRCICFMQVYIYLRGYEGYLQSWCGCHPQLGTDDAQLGATLHPHEFQTRFYICKFWLV